MPWPVKVMVRLAPALDEPVSVRPYADSAYAGAQPADRPMAELRSSTACGANATGPRAHGLQCPAASTARNRKRQLVSSPTSTIACVCVALSAVDGLQAPPLRLDCSS